MSIAVIGAGASGIAAALQAAWRGAAVTLFERNAAVGRKLLVTGSGRCNITNRAAAADTYACVDPAWMERLLADFGVDDWLAMLAEVGIPVYATPDGWYYPLSESAHSVVEAFASGLARARVDVRLSAQVTAIQPKSPGFSLRVAQNGGRDVQHFERVIVAAGGAAYPSLGSRGELFAELARLGHNPLPKRPALAPVLAELGGLRSLQGVRLDAGVILYEGQQQLARAQGNLIFTAWGLNGPPVMDLSHHISARPGARLSLGLDLLAFCRDAYAELLRRKRASDLPLRVFLAAFFPPKLAPAYLKMAGLEGDVPLGGLDDASLQRLTAWLEDTRLAVKGVRGFEYCQVSAGGVPVHEVDPRTMESRIVPGLHLAGETLDVVGPCGGYNLQFAFSSGALAGMAAAQAVGAASPRR